MPPVDETLDCDFKGGVTDKTLFPYDAWCRCLNQALRQQARAGGGGRGVSRSGRVSRNCGSTSRDIWPSAAR